MYINSNVYEQGIELSFFFNICTDIMSLGEVITK